jgi:hypothetical protein
MGNCMDGWKRQQHQAAGMQPSETACFTLSCPHTQFGCTPFYLASIHLQLVPPEGLIGSLHLARSKPYHPVGGGCIPDLPSQRLMMGLDGRRISSLAYICGVACLDECLLGAACRVCWLGKALSNERELRSSCAW